MISSAVGVTFGLYCVHQLWSSVNTRRMAYKLHSNLDALNSMFSELMSSLLKVSRSFCPMSNCSLGRFSLKDLAVKFWRCLKRTSLVNKGRGDGWTRNPLRGRRKLYTPRLTYLRLPPPKNNQRDAQEKHGIVLSRNPSEEGAFCQKAVKGAFNTDIAHLFSKIAWGAWITKYGKRLWENTTRGQSYSRMISPSSSIDTG